MLTTKLFADNRLHRGRITRFVDALFRRLSDAYESLLRRTIRRPFIIILSALAIFLTSLSLLNKLPVEYMPREDRGFAMINLTAPDGASLDYTLGYVKEAERIALADKEKGDVLRVLGLRITIGVALFRIPKTIPKTPTTNRAAAGNRTMVDDAMDRIRNGESTVEEVLRVLPYRYLKNALSVSSVLPS